MKVIFKKVLYEEFDIDYQKIFNLIVSEVGSDEDWNLIYKKFVNNIEYYIRATHNIYSLFDKYDLIFSFSDNEEALNFIEDDFFVFLRDKYNF